MERLRRQVAFILEIDRAKEVLRRNFLADGGRRENDAEHMWHLAVMVLVLAEHASEPVDVPRVLELLLVHDIVEIDAGDTFVYDEGGHDDKHERERRAAERIFGLLPTDQAERFRSAWEEFESRETAEARFAAAVDRFQPILLNHASGGVAWRQHGITAEQVVRVNAPMGEMAPAFWEFARALIADAVDRGLLGGD